MHECRWTERRFTRVTKIDVATEIVLEFLRQAERKFVEEIVRMLSIMQRLAIPRFAALKEKRITAPPFGERIEAHHQARPNLCGVAERMRIHRHDPIRCIDAVVSA